MKRSASLTAMSTVLAVLALIAHLWMLDGPDLSATPTGSVLLGPVEAATTMTGCASGMSACHVPMPDELPADVELLPTSGLLAIAVLLARRVGNSTVADDPERGPPRRPYSPSSVVLLN